MHSWVEHERSEGLPGAKRHWRAAEGRMRQLVMLKDGFQGGLDFRMLGPMRLGFNLYVALAL